MRLTIVRDRPTSKQLEIDLSESNEVMIHILTDEAIASGEFSNWDHAYETMWVWLEYALHVQREEQEELTA